jgi:hypothetical protein
MKTPWKVPQLWPGETVAVIGTGASATPEAIEAVRSLPTIAANAAIALVPHADMLVSIDANWPERATLRRHPRGGRALRCRGEYVGVTTRWCACRRTRWCTSATTGCSRCASRPRRARRRSCWWASTRRPTRRSRSSWDTTSAATSRASRMLKAELEAAGVEVVHPGVSVQGPPKPSPSTAGSRSSGRSSRRTRSAPRFTWTVHATVYAERRDQLPSRSEAMRTRSSSPATRCATASAGARRGPRCACAMTAAVLQIVGGPCRARAPRVPRIHGRADRAGGDLMADLKHVKGLRGARPFLQELPPKIERNVLRGALRAGAAHPEAGPGERPSALRQTARASRWARAPGRPRWRLRAREGLQGPALARVRHAAARDQARRIARRSHRRQGRRAGEPPGRAPAAVPAPRARWPGRRGARCAWPST